jgi:hypothetical protein
VALRVQQHVFGLYVAVHHAMRVEVLQGKHQLRKVHARRIFQQQPVLAQGVKQLATRAVVAYQKHAAARLERKAQRHDKGVPQPRGNGRLRQRVRHLRLLLQKTLRVNLHGVHAPRRGVRHLQHLPKRAAANHAEKDEIGGLRG